MVTIIANSECRLILPHTIEKALEDFDKAAQAYGLLGSNDPEDYDKVEFDYKSTKVALKVLLGLM